MQLPELSGSCYCFINSELFLMKYIICFMLMFTIGMGKSHCQSIDASPAGVMISHGHPKGGFMLSYSYMNMKMGENLSGSDKISDEEIFKRDYSMSPQDMTMNMHMLMAMYGITGKLSVMGMINYSDQEMDMISYSTGHVHNGSTGMHTTSHSHHSSGFGDIKLWGLYKLYNGVGSSLVANLGISLPTGDYKIPAGQHATFEGERSSYMMQLGTGSWDFMPGITWLKTGNKLSYSVQLLGVIRPFDNPLNYHWGNEICANAWGAYQVLPFLGISLRGEAVYSDAISGMDPMIYAFTEPASNPVNYGGNKIKGLGGLNLYGSKGILRESKLGMEYGLPLYQDVNGIQQSMESVLYITLTKSF